jgi:hypothetical protein
VNHFRQGFAAELIKLSAVAPENPPLPTYDAGDAYTKATTKKKGLGDALPTKPATPKPVSGPLTTPTAMTNYVSGAKE